LDITITLRLPKVIVERIRDLGIDIESKIIDIIIKELALNPKEEVKVYLELAMRFLGEGKELIDKDIVQACEKLYKAAEECIKALSLHFKLEDILRKVKERGRWTVAELEKAVEVISDRIGGWFYDAWDHAWVLHVWGFHEAKLDSEAVKRRLPYIEKIVKETKKITGVG